MNTETMRADALREASRTGDVEAAVVRLTADDGAVLTSANGCLFGDHDWYKVALLLRGGLLRETITYWPALDLTEFGAAVRDELRKRRRAAEDAWCKAQKIT